MKQLQAFHNVSEGYQSLSIASPHGHLISHRLEVDFDVNFKMWKRTPTTFLLLLWDHLQVVEKASPALHFHLPEFSPVWRARSRLYRSRFLRLNIYSEI